MSLRKRNRRGNAFNLAFLDVMSCGLGAAVLLFLIVKHGITQNPSEATETVRLKQDMVQRAAEITNIETNIGGLKEQAGKNRKQVAGIKVAISATGGKVAAARQASKRLSGEIVKAKKALSAAETVVAKKEKDSRIEIAGQSSQQFLTGLSVKGKRIVILVDHSASMLDEKIINIIRRRAIGGETASKAPKWDRAQRIAQWLVNRLPENSQVRFVSFAETASVIPVDRWLKATDTKAVTAALQKTINMTPNGGTNLYQGFDSLNRISPAPDAVYLVTDGLPTLGRSKPKRTTVTGRQRLALFNEAVRSMARVRATVNVILLPIEGDPDAAFAYWQLSRTTGGRMLSPSGEWP